VPTYYENIREEIYKKERMRERTTERSINTHSLKLIQATK
jgi:hypothetical protein